MIYFYNLIHTEKNLVSGFVEFDEEICNANDGLKAFDNLLKILSENHKTEFTRENSILTSFSKL